MSRVLSIDPGEDTGYALWEDGKIISFGTWRGMSAAYRALYTLTWDEGVSEDFIISERTLETRMEGRASLFLIGWFGGLCDLQDASLTLQRSTDGLGFGTERKRKAMGWYGLGDEHTQSAISHLITYLYDTQRITAKELLS